MFTLTASEDPEFHASSHHHVEFTDLQVRSASTVKLTSRCSKLVDVNVLFAFAGRASAAVVMRLLLRALRPTLDALEPWIQQGRLEDHLDELMVCKGDVPLRACLLR